MTVPEKMHLAIDCSFSHLNGRWRTPGSWMHRTYPDPTMYEDLARIAERGCIDMLFFGDGSGIPSTWQDSIEVAARWGIGWPRQDMSPYIARMAAVTQHLGFCLTYATTFMPPFYVARLLNSLDHITNGRIAFNVITSTRRADAANYGFDDLMEHDLRYDRMEEFIDVCKALWASVEPDAFIWDRESGVVADPDKVHPINHVGEYFRVKGPLNTVPSPQGRPVLIQAGGSPRGIMASAHFADMIFSAAWGPARVRHRAELDKALIAKGRHPSETGILFATSVIVGETEEEARARKEKLLTITPPEGVGAFLSHESGWDFSTLPDRFAPSELNREIIATQASPVGFVASLAERLGEGATMTRDEFLHYGMRFSVAYDRTFAGTAAQVADHLEEDFEKAGSRGGFMIVRPYTIPRDMMSIVDFLVPELQRRGRFRTKYEGRTLYENFFDITSVPAEGSVPAHAV
jgi:FMN-dependent oxidoreductase (nitrilotriacetate monooxygenase family)